MSIERCSRVDFGTSDTSLIVGCTVPVVMAFVAVCLHVYVKFVILRLPGWDDLVLVVATVPFWSFDVSMAD